MTFVDLSIVIVNWKSLDYTLGCIASLHENVTGIEFEIIVVDNASGENCETVVRNNYPAVRVLSSPTNVGFAAANNLGFQNAAGDAILFLNPDTRVRPHSIERMLQELNARPEIGIAGCRLLNGDLTLQISCVQPFPTIANQLLGLNFLKKRWPRAPLWGTPELSPQASGATEVEVVSGACLMIKREVFEHVNQFSTEYFMYAEEADLCQKVRLAGWKVCHVANSEVIHFGGQSTGKQASNFADVVMRDSTFRLLRKFRGTAYACAYRAVLLASAALRLGVLGCWMALPTRRHSRRYVRTALRKWFSIARWALALEGWTQNLAAGGARALTPTQTST